MQIQTVADQLYFMTVRIEGHRGTRVSRATGFIYRVRVARGDEQGDAYFLVTNEHVLDQATDLLLLKMIRSADDQNREPSLGDEATIRISSIKDGWYRHPDPDVDVAVIPFGRILNTMIADDNRPFFRAVDAELAPTEEDERNLLNSIEEILFVGYPNALFDTKNLTPIIRRGTTATPIALDYEGEPAFLIDASVFPGSSGSPVFILDRGMWENRDGNVNIGRRFILLGIVASVHVRNVEAELQKLPTRHGVAIEDPLNLGVVYKTSAIDECVDVVLAKAGIERLADQEKPQQEATQEAENGGEVTPPVI